MKIPTLKTLRKEMGRSQKEMADLLGVSTKAVQSYEQGWRSVPPHVEQVLLLHAILRRHKDLSKLPLCWQVNHCSIEACKACPAYNLLHGGFCWLITGTLCKGQPTGSWEAKRRLCLQCKVMKAFLTPDA